MTTQKVCSNNTVCTNSDVCIHQCELQDRQEILDLISRYCRAVDRADYVSVRDVYSIDGVDHHTGFSGSADDFVEWVKERTAVFDGTMHIVGTHLAEIDGDSAFAETYGTAHHWGEPRDDARVNFTSGFRYLDSLRREPGGWRIVERYAVREWTKSDASLLQAPEGPGFRGQRGSEDPLFTLGFAQHKATAKDATDPA